MSDKEFESTPEESVTPPVVMKESTNKGKLIGIIIAVVVLLALVIFSLVSLFRADLETTSKVRDIFIIIMALESLLLGVALIILIIQIAVLINVLKNEIKPILDTTNETINHLRGTTTFLSNNLVEPVIKMNEYSAGLGGLTGAVASLLLAPQSGEETRTVIKERAIELKDKASETAEDVYSKAEVAANDAVKRAEELLKEAKSKAVEAKEKGVQLVEEQKTKLSKKITAETSTDSPAEVEMDNRFFIPI